MNSKLYIHVNVGWWRNIVIDPLKSFVLYTDRQTFNHSWPVIRNKFKQFLYQANPVPARCESYTEEYRTIHCTLNLQRYDWHRLIPGQYEDYTAYTLLTFKMHGPATYQTKYWAHYYRIFVPLKWKCADQLEPHLPSCVLDIAVNCTLDQCPVSSDTKTSNSSNCLWPIRLASQSSRFYLLH